MSEAMSTCASCGRKFPTAPPDHVHKCVCGGKMVPDPAPLGMRGGVPAGELLPCPNPWCERIEGVEASRHLVTERWHVCCDDCMIEGPWAKTYDEAVAAWNTRATPTPPIEGRDADVERVREALTPSSGTKAAYHGEFTFDLCVGISDAGIEQYQKVYVPWDTVKEIMAAIRARAALQALGERG